MPTSCSSVALFQNTFAVTSPNNADCPARRHSMSIWGSPWLPTQANTEASVGNSAAQGRLRHPLYPPSLRRRDCFSYRLLCRGSPCRQSRLPRRTPHLEGTLYHRNLTRPGQSQPLRARSSSHWRIRRHSTPAHNASAGHGGRRRTPAQGRHRMTATLSSLAKLKPNPPLGHSPTLRPHRLEAHGVSGFCGEHTDAGRAEGCAGGALCGAGAVGPAAPRNQVIIPHSRSTQTAPCRYHFQP